MLIWQWTMNVIVAKCCFCFFLSIQWTAAQALANITSVSQPPASSFGSAGSGKRTAMSSGLNLVMTTIGFVVSAIFIVFVLVRLLCARLQSWRFSSDRNSSSSQNLGSERHSHGINPLLFPTIKYFRQIFASQEDTACIVCLEEYEDRDCLRILPKCGHAFHVKCIDAWLRQHSTCPVCRIPLQNISSRKKMPLPLLSEAARSRFTPGAIPETLFEQPLPNTHFVLPRQNLHATTNNAHIIEISETKESSEVSHHSYYRADHT